MALTPFPDQITDISVAADSGADAALPRIGGLIRERRKAARLTLQALCDAAGLSVGYLSQIERDQATPSLASLTALARALGVGVEYFIATPSAQDALSRAEGRPRFHVEGSSVVYEKLSSEFPGSQMTSYMMHVPPGYQSEVVSHEGEEFMIVLEGQIVQWLGADEMTLNPGDALHFRGSQTHAWANRTTAPARILWTGRLNLFQPALTPDAPQKPEENPALPDPVQRR